MVFVRDVPSDDDDDDDDNVRRRKAKKLKQIRRQPLGDIINFGINLENKHAGTESTPSDDIGLLSKELTTKHVQAASSKKKLVGAQSTTVLHKTLSIKKNEIFQLKAIISQLKSTELRKNQEATALKETVAKIKEDYETLALDHATAIVDQKEEISQLKATCANVIATSKDKVSQLKATFANVITTSMDTNAILELRNKKKDEEAVVLNNKISQFEVEVSTLAEERDLLAVRLDGEVQGNECVVCRESRKACLFLPCRHMCVCEGCASLIQSNDRKCPLCRTVSEQVMRVFH